MMPAIVPGLAPLVRVSIPEGTFAMGSTLFRDSQPVTDVALSAFYVSKTKVTIEQHDAYLAAIRKNRITLAVTDPQTGIVSIVGRGKTEREVVDGYMKSLGLRGRLSAGGVVEVGGLTVFEVTTPDLPPEFREFTDQPQGGVSWWELAAFAAAHGGRLPIEAQCERIMRGRSGKDEYGALDGKLRAEDGRKLAQFGEAQTSRVKEFPANSWGVFDASGNVWNWTDTWYTDSYKGLEKKDPRGPKEGTCRVLRGGSYYGGGGGLHAACRVYYDPLVRYENIGGVVVWRSQDSR